MANEWAYIIFGAIVGAAVLGNLIFLSIFGLSSQIIGAIIGALIAYLYVQERS